MSRLTLTLCLFTLGCIHIEAPVENNSVPREGNLAIGRSYPKMQDAGTYRVKKGDTLYSIALAKNMQISVLAQINEINQPYSIYPGQVLNLSVVESAKEQRARQREAREQAQRAALKPVDNNTQSNKAPPGQWLWPISGKVKLGRKFNSSKKHEHTGIDLMAKRGVAVLSTAGGLVEFAGRNVPGYGNFVLVAHSGDYHSSYSHLQDISVVKGAEVDAGDQLGTVGDSDTDKVHLHFEIRKKNLTLDPLAVLPPKR